MSFKNFLFVVTIFFHALSVASANSGVDLAPLEACLIQRNQYSSIITTVKQEKVLPSLSKPLVTKGKLWLVPQYGFRWEQGNPVKDIALFDSNRVYLLNEDSKTAERYKAGSRAVRPLMLLMGMGKDASYEGILDNFKPTYSEIKGSVYTVSLQPDSGIMKRALSQLTLSIDLKTCFPKKIIWLQKDGAIITTHFGRPRFNTGIDTQMFQFNEGAYAIKD